ncbi:MAG: hypothetical protein QNI99_10065 [Woeseiaceae bacterium]|nr:hypothetical protein [Woeseiaceae bacterium]
MKHAATLLIALLLTPATAALAQSSGELDREAIQDLRELVQTQREQEIRDALRLTSEEAERFWPVWERYNDELNEVRDRRVEMIVRYLEAFSNAEVDAELARDLLNEFLDIESDMLRIRKRYVRRFQQVIPAMKVTRFYQLENKLDAEVDAELAATMPLFDPM